MQLPLKMAWGFTINKSQSLTLEKVVVELGEKDFPAGLSFVAIFQVKTLQSLAFCTCFNHTHFKTQKTLFLCQRLMKTMSITTSWGFI
jgi:hypothetical protein